MKKHTYLVKCGQKFASYFFGPPCSSVIKNSQTWATDCAKKSKPKGPCIPRISTDNHRISSRILCSRKLPIVPHFSPAVYFPLFTR